MLNKNVVDGIALSRNSLTQEVMEYVRQSVLDQSMRPGEWYSVYQLAEVLSISRTPVRDGLLRLEEAGLIEFVRNRGFRISRTTPADVAEIFSMRIALEVPAARRAGRLKKDEVEELDRARSAMEEAAGHGDSEVFFFHDRALHSAILTAGGARRALEVVERLRSVTQLLGASTAVSQRSLAEILREHDPIINAIRAGDSEAAAEAMLNHLARTGRLLVEQAILRTGSGDDPNYLWDKFAEGYTY